MFRLIENSLPIMFIKILKILSIIAISSGVSFAAYEYYTSNHKVDFQLDDKYDIELYIDECGTCFLDWQIDFKIQITDQETNKKYKYKFWMGQGPYIQFAFPKTGENQLIIQGYHHNRMHNWLIDFDKNKISQMRDVNEIEEVWKTHESSYKLNNKFEIVKK